MYRILLVDDEILVRDAIKENIDWGAIDCELVGDCENGKQAARICKRTPGGYCTDGYIDAIYGWNGTEQFFA